MLRGFAGLTVNTNGCWSCARAGIEYRNKTINKASERSAVEYSARAVQGSEGGSVWNTVRVAMSFPWPLVERHIVESERETVAYLSYRHKT